MEDKQWKLRVVTDLAVEAAEILCDEGKRADSEEAKDDEIDGVGIEVSEEDGVKITVIEIKTENGAEQMGKPIGKYVTIESDALKENDVDTHERIIKELTDQLARLSKIGRDSSVLVVGLGNWNVTPDALGPRVVSKILVTRHIMENARETVGGAVRSVAAVSPGVMGLTGIETADIVKGVASKIKPDLIIAIDALAARHSGRINAAIQMTDTGISPGAGMGNRRAALNEESLGAPVIAIGVPTVVDAATLVNDSLDLMLSSMIQELQEGSQFYGMLNNLESQEKYGFIRGVLDPYTGNMFVTPKEVDEVIERLSNIIANAVNIAMHPGITKDDINRYLY